MEKMEFSDSTKAKKSTKENYDMKKGGSTNSLFMCFRPVVLESDQPVITYIASVPKIERSVVIPTNDIDGLSFEEREEQSDFEGKKISASRRFSRVWKAVLFETSMARKIKKGKLKKNPPNSLSIESARYNYQETSNKDNFDFGQRILSRSASALATSSSASTAASNSLCPNCSSLIAKTKSFRPNPNGSKSTSTTKENNGCNLGLCLMLLSLLVLVFWGRICAIFCTSTWFFLMPRWIAKEDRINMSILMKKSPESKRNVVKGT